MSKVVERVARALCPEPPDGTDRRIGDDGRSYPAGVPHWKAHEGEARAAIAAARPTAEECEHLSDHFDNDITFGSGSQVRAIFRDYFDAALKDSP